MTHRLLLLSLAPLHILLFGAACVTAESRQELLVEAQQSSFHKPSINIAELLLKDLESINDPIDGGVNNQGNDEELQEASSNELRLLNIGTDQYSRGEWLESLDTLMQALFLFQQSSDQRREAEVLGKIGDNYQALGSYSDALKSYQDALFISQEIADYNIQAAALNNIGNIYQALGQYEQALDYFQKSLILKRRYGNHDNEANTLNNIGLLYLKTGDYQSSLDHLLQSLALKRRLNDALGVADILNNIGAIHLVSGEYFHALDHFEQSLTLKRQFGNRRGEANTLNNIGFLHERTGNYSEALEHYRYSLEIKREIGDLVGEARTLGNIGSVFDSQDQTVLAIVFFKQAINTYEAIRESNQALAQSLQDTYIATIEDDYRVLAALLLQQDRVLEAQRVLDLLKVQELDDYLRGVRSRNTTEGGIGLLPQEQAFLNNSDSILDQAVPVAEELKTLRAIPFPERSEAQKQRINTLEAQQSAILDQFLAFIASEEVQALITQLSATAQDQDLITELDQFARLRDNLKRLGNAALLYPLILEDRLELVLVTPDSPPVNVPVPVDRATLTQAVSDFQGQLRDSASNPQPLAQQLYQWLIADLDEALTTAGIETIIYAPDGVLRYIPLSALHDGEQWLAERYRINHITAASLTDLEARDSADPLVLAGAFSEGNHSVPAGEDVLEFDGLPFAGVEVDLLAKAFPTTPLSNEAFSRDATIPIMNDHTIVHLATHAALLIGSPLDSFILFGNGDRLTLQEIKEDWTGYLQSVDLMVLSACETGTGSIKDETGEEILGFGYLMQDAGARAVVASLWAVSDGGTQELMTNFYQALLAEGMTKAEALQQAQIALITGQQLQADPGAERGVTLRPRTPEASQIPSDRLSHPYYWAPFILIGNGL